MILGIIGFPSLSNFNFDKVIEEESRSRKRLSNFNFDRFTEEVGKLQPFKNNQCWKIIPNIGKIIPKMVSNNEN